MDTSLDTYRELKRETDTFISSFKKKHYEQFKEKYGVFPDEWVLYQDELIKLVSKCTPEECFGVMIYFQLAIDRISNIKQDADKILIQYDWSILHLWAKEKNYKQIEIECKGCGKMGLFLGYFLFLYLSVLRFVKYVESNPSGFHAFILRFPHLWEESAKSREQLKELITEKNFASGYFYKKMKKKQTKKGGDFVSYILGKARKILPEDPVEAILKIANKEKEVSKICMKAADKLIYEEITKPRRHDTHRKFKIEDIKKEYSPSYIFKNPETISPYSLNGEKEHVREELLSWRDSQPKQAFQAKLIVDCLIQNKDNPNFSFDKTNIAKWVRKKSNSKCDRKTVKRVLEKIAQDLPHLKIYLPK